MNVQIQSVKFDADRKLVEFVEHKMDKLDRFVERAIGADVILKLDKDHELGNKVATINLHIPGDDLVAESRGKSFEEAVDLSIEALKRQIDKYKGRLEKENNVMVMHSGDLKRSPLCIYSPHFIRKIPSYYINRENSAMQMTRQAAKTEKPTQFQRAIKTPLLRN